MTNRTLRQCQQSAAAVSYHISAAVLTALFVAPLLWMVATSLRKVGAPPPIVIDWLPQPPAWQNYGTIFRIVPLAVYVQNSLWVSLLGMSITLLTASLAGFAMAQLPPRPRRVLLRVTVLVMMAPPSGLWLARFVIFSKLGLIDSYGALIAPALMGTNAAFVLLLYWSFRQAPADLFTAAQLDGAGPWRCWWQIGLPLARPTLAAVAVLTFVTYWSDFIEPLLYLKSESRYTLAIGLRILQQLDVTNWPLLMAGATVMTIPVLVGYLLAQRYAWLEGRLAGLVQ